VDASLLKRDLAKSHESQPALVAIVKAIYETPKDNYHWVLLFEAMLDFDEKFALWRSTHMLMVARAIGRKKGTGGSEGYKFLQSREPLRFFPELWDVRNQNGGAY
jgi:tryptophan 2,3-dioxygenase